MSRLRIVPIVEGHGEDNAIRILLQRIWCELLAGEYVEVLKPIRGKRLKLVQAAELARFLDLAVSKFELPKAGPQALVLLLLDADADPPCLLGPRILELARKARADTDITCVIANVEFETWFAAAAESLGKYLDLSRDETTPDQPEQARVGKAWIQSGSAASSIDPRLISRALPSRWTLPCADRGLRRSTSSVGNWKRGSSECPDATQP